MNELKKLIDVKTIVTFSVIGAVIYLSVVGKIESKDIYVLGAMIVTYFFNKDKVTPAV